MVRRLLLACLLGLLTVQALAGQIRLSGMESSLALSDGVEAYEDSSGRMDAEEVARRGDFALRPELLHPGYTSSAIWLKLELANDSGAPLVRWLSVQPSRLRDVSLFVREADGWRRLDAGTGIPFARWPVAAPNAVLPLELPPDRPLVAYLRVASPFSIAIAPSLWEPLAFREAEGRTRMVDGLFLGGLLAMPLIGLLLLFLLRDRAFLFNILGTLTFFIGEFSAKGYSFMVLWPGATEWATRCLPLFPVFGVAWHILFLRELLATRQAMPRADRLLLALLAVQTVPALGLLSGDYSAWAQVSAGLNLLSAPAMVVVGILAARRGIKAARYYIAAFAVLAIGGLLHVSSLMGLRPYVGSIEYALPIAMLLNNALMLASVVDRIMLVRKEREDAREALLAARAAQGAELERQVAERTADLNAALVETRRAKEAQSRLVAYVSHDLRAPLATIVNYVHLLEQDGDADLRRHRATIEKSALHQLELIDDLVEYARGELDHLELVPAPTFLHDWLEGIAGQAELLAGQRSNRFLLDAAGELPPVLVFDPKRLRQVLINLLGNAAKFTGGGEIRLGIEGRPLPGGRVELAFAVADTGPGIPPQDVERIFLPFERRQSTREGSGLGLSIARQLVRAMGGDIEVASTPGQGSRFAFRLAFDTAAEAEVQPPVQTFTLPKSFGTGRTLLVADDSEVSREYLREIFLVADFDVVCARDGGEALDLARQRPFDAILADQAMPVLDGWQLLARLHKELGAGAPPLILCSAMPPRRPDGYPEGIDFRGSLLKPVAPERLFRTLQELFCRPPAQPVFWPSEPMLAQLRRLVAGGNITDIEDWADMLAHSNPDYGEFARRVRVAARDIDLGQLAILAGGHGSEPVALKTETAFSGE